MGIGETNNMNSKYGEIYLENEDMKITDVVDSIFKIRKDKKTEKHAVILGNYVINEYETEKEALKDALKVDWKKILVVIQINEELKTK